MKPQVNNDYYNHLGRNWYDADDDPIAVLRAESFAKNPWVDRAIKAHFGRNDLSIADVGCGAGFLSNYLAQRYSRVHGLDASKSSLDMAKMKDTASRVDYVLGDAYKLPYEDKSMDVVCAMDFLEHVEHPEKVIEECSRILKPGGMFFYHTFNRNFLSWLIVIKFMEWFMPNTPKNLHVLHLFIKPKELRKMMALHNLENRMATGISPRFNFSFFASIFARKLLSGFKFKIGGPTTLGYIGYAVKSGK